MEKLTKAEAELLAIQDKLDRAKTRKEKRKKRVPAAMTLIVTEGRNQN